MTIMPSFTHPHAIPNPVMVVSHYKQEGRTQMQHTDLFNKRRQNTKQKPTRGKNIIKET